MNPRGNFGSGYSHRLKVQQAKSVYRWQPYEWQDCTTTCGPGTQMRDVRCFNDKGEESTFCLPRMKPITIRNCQIRPCYHNLKWVEGDWSEVSLFIFITHKRKFYFHRRVTSRENDICRACVCFLL